MDTSQVLFPGSRGLSVRYRYFRKAPSRHPCTHIVPVLESARKRGDWQVETDAAMGQHRGTWGASGTRKRAGHTTGSRAPRPDSTRACRQRERHHWDGKPLGWEAGAGSTSRESAPAGWRPCHEEGLATPGTAYRRPPSGCRPRRAPCSWRRGGSSPDRPARRWRRCSSP